MYRPVYNSMFWGFIFALLDFRVSAIDIIPDFIGFIMIFSALGKLTAQHEYFGKARPFAFALILLALPDLIQLQANNLLENPMSSQLLGFVLNGQIFMIAELFMVFWICKAIYTLAQQTGLSDLAARARSRWHFFLGITAGVIFITPFTYNLPEEWQALFIVMVISGFAANLLIMFLIRSAGREISGDDTAAL